MKSSTRRTAAGALALGIALGSIPVALGGNATGDLARYAERKLDRPVAFKASASQLRTGLHQSLRQAQGLQTVIVRLVNQPLANPVADGMRSMHERALRQTQQARFLERHAQRAAGMRVLGQTQLVLNAIFMEVDASALDGLAADKEVLRIAPVADYEMDLTETVPYIGATAVQNAGFDGTGVSIAILDSGIDYTHAHLGGPGTVAAYEAAYGLDPSDPLNTTRDGLFPTAKVVEGFDFVGEVWPNGDLAPDPDPIDFGAHGTNVADISGGLGGVAPGTDLYAVKVCSAVSSSCSGIALIQGMEYAVDPNDDGMTDDHVDIINMSLGSGYGQPFDDDLAAAVENATAIGVLTVASAGNGADKPYVTGTPSAAATALSVAQTQVPSAALQLLTVDGIDYTAIFQAWSTPLSGVVSAPVQYGDGAGGNLNGCDPFAAGSLAGKIVLVDRGACFFTTKIFNVGNAGGLVGIIGLIAPGGPFSGGFADPGGPITIPGFMVSQADADAIRASIDAGNDSGVADPANVLPLVQSMVSSSSRGPRNQDNLLKPEIGAPGGSVSALAGTGDGTRVFGGTSGAAPMVAGSAALLIEAFRATRGADGDVPPAIVKAVLMNTGETDIDTDPFTGLAPVSRIGGGEVRVDRALNAGAVAWDAATLQGGLSFGFVDVDGTSEMTRTVNVLGLGDETRAPWTITPGFRFADDADSGAISVDVPASVDVLPGVVSSFDITITIDGAKLPGNFMNSGSNGANPAALTLNEYDGYLTLSNGSDSIHLPWHVLPRKAARVQSAPPVLPGGPFGGGPANRGLKLKNRGVGTAQVDGYTLLATSPDIPSGGPGQQSPTPDLRAVGVKTIPVPADFCSDNESFLLVFAANTWERQTHLVPVSHQFSIDIGQDGTFEYVVLNRDLSFTGVSDGRQATFVFDTATEETTAFFFAEHATNTGNTALTICAEQIGMTAADLGTTTVDLEVFAQDFYFGGPGDLIEGLSMTPGGERLDVISTDIAPDSVERIEVVDNGSGEGIGLLLFTNGDRGSGARGGATQETEALIINTAGSGGSK